MGEIKFPHHCKRCEYEWESKLESPKVCPRCKSYFFSQPLKRKEIPNVQSK